jgi:hypothetical protein
MNDYEEKEHKQVEEQKYTRIYKNKVEEQCNKRPQRSEEIPNR